MTNLIAKDNMQYYDYAAQSRIAFMGNPQQYSLKNQECQFVVL